MKLCIVLGTRPELIKFAPIISELQENNINFFIIHTGQHYSYNMDRTFFEDLGLPEPKFLLNVGSSTYSEQTAKMLIELEKIFVSEKPSCVLTLGDTNSTLAGSLAAAKCAIPVCHIESGTRSFDRRMPEEINRRIAEICSEYLFVHSDLAMLNLLTSGIPRHKIFLVGNTCVDSCLKNLEIAKSKFKHLNYGRYLLLTLHRSETVDDKNILTNILETLGEIDYKIIFPVHPRCKKNLEHFGLDKKIKENIVLTDPMGYLEFLYCLSNAKAVITDSGGVRQESLYLKTPCIILHDTTSDPELINSGGAILGTTKKNALKQAISFALSEEFRLNFCSAKKPFGTGNAAKKIVKIILRLHEEDKLKISRVDMSKCGYPSWRLVDVNDVKEGVWFFEGIDADGKLAANYKKTKYVKTLGPVNEPTC